VALSTILGVAGAFLHDFGGETKSGVDASLLAFDVGVVSSILGAFLQDFRGEGKSGVVASSLLLSLAVVVGVIVLREKRELPIFLGGLTEVDVFIVVLLVVESVIATILPSISVQD